MCGAAKMDLQRRKKKDKVELDDAIETFDSREKLSDKSSSLTNKPYSASSSQECIACKLKIINSKEGANCKQRGEFA